MWLIFCFVVLWTGFSEAYASITLTLFVPLTLAAFGIVLRGSSFAFRKTVFRTRDRRNFGAAFAISSVLVPYCIGADRRRHRLGSGARRRRRRRPVGQLGQPDVGARRRPRRRRRRLPRRRLPRLGRPPARATTRWPTYFRRRAIGAAVVAGVVAARRHLRPAGRRPLRLRRADRRGRSRSSSSPPCAAPPRSCCSCATPPAGHALLAIGAVASIVVGWGVAQWPYILPDEPRGGRRRGAVGHARHARRRHRPARSSSSSPASRLLYVLDQRTLLPEEGTDL